MEPARPDGEPGDDDRRFSAGWTVAGLVVVALAAWGTVAAVTHRDAEDVVEDYLTAITDKDVAGALALVSPYGYGVPYGPDAMFLTPEAISDDWWVVSVEEVRKEYSSSVVVEAEIAGPGGTAKGEFGVTDVDGEWMLDDPFVKVEFPDSPLSYIRANDQVVPRPIGTQPLHTYTLFPGLYSFYQSVPGVVSTERTEPVIAFPPSPDDTSSDDPAVSPRAMTAGDRLVERTQRAIERHIDDCVGFAVAAPPSPCPFATDGEIDTPDGRRVTDVHSLTWTVERQPVVELADNRDDNNPGFIVRSAEPGTMTLSGAGIDTAGQPATFAVTCDVDLLGMRIIVGADGQPEISGQAPPGDSPYDYSNTCRRNP